MSDIGILFFPFSYISGTYFFYSGNRFLVVIMNRKNYELFLVSCSFNYTSGLYKIVVWNQLNIQTPETISFVWHLAGLPLSISEFWLRPYISVQHIIFLHGVHKRPTLCDPSQWNIYTEANIANIYIFWNHFLRHKNIRDWSIHLPQLVRYFRWIITPLKHQSDMYLPLLSIVRFKMWRPQDLSTVRGLHALFV